MRLLELEVTNWGPHKHWLGNLDSSIVGIIGANGKGKSSLLTAIAFAITGNLPFNKLRYIHELTLGDPNKSGSGYKASVRLKFEANGQQGEITRTISETSSSRKLVWQGETITKDADVTAAMEDIMGADNASLQNAVFIRQGEIAALINETPAVRQEILRKQMNLNFLAARAEDVRTRLRSLELKGAIDYNIQIADLRADQDEKLSRLSELLNAYEPYKELETMQDAYKKWQHANTVIQRLDSKKKGITRMLDEIKQSLKSDATGEALTAQLTKEMQKCAAEERQLRKCTDKSLELTALESHIQLDVQSRLNAHEEAKRRLLLYNHPEDVLENAKKCINYKEEESRLETEIENLKIFLHDLMIRKESMERMVAVEEKRILLLQEDETHRRAQIQQRELQQSILEGYTETGVCPICGAAMDKNHILKRLEVTDEQEGIQKLKDILLAANQDLEFTRKDIATAQKYVANTRKGVEEYFHDIKDTEAKLDAAAKRYKEIDSEYVELCNTASMQMILENVVTALPSDKALLEIEKLKNEHIMLKRNILSVEEEAKLQKELQKCKERQSALRSEIMYAWQQIFPQADPKILPGKHTLSAQIDTRMKMMCAYSGKIAEINRLLTQREKLMKDLEEVEGDLRKFQKGELKPVEDKLLTFIATHDRFKDGTLDNWEEWSREQVRRKQEIDSLEQTVKEGKERLEAVLAAKEKVVRINETADTLREISTMLSREGLPAAFMQSIFSQLTSMVQEFLAQMGTNFSIRVDESRPCSFLFTNMDGYEMPQESMSGGQAVRLALAMLLATQRIILPEVGLLILDEPTSHVDAEGVDHIRTLFQNLSVLLKNAGMQLIVVDHNPALQDGFEQSIVL